VADDRLGSGNAMFREHLRPIGREIAEHNAPEGTDPAVVDELADGYCTSLNDILIRRLTETLSESELARLEHALDAESAEEINRILMLPAVQQMMKDECERFVTDHLDHTSDDTVAWGEVATGYYVKVTSSGRQFLLELHADGRLTESDRFSSATGWDGRWRQALLPVSARKAGPGGWGNHAHGIVTNIGPYTGYLLEYSPTYFAGIEYEDGRKVGLLRLLYLGDTPQVLDIDRLNELHGEPAPRFR